MQSFIGVPPGSDFPLENLPWGAFALREGADGSGLSGSSSGSGGLHLGVALGEHVVSATALQAAGYLRDLPGAPPNVFGTGRLNEFMAAGRPAWAAARAALQRLLSAAEGELRDNAALRQRAVFKQSDVAMHLPAHIGDYTDFYASRHHATNVGAMFRGPANALNPNWLHLPVGYHGRASSIVPSGVDVRRPRGQVLPAGAASPTFGPSAQVDFELEVAAVVGPGNALGEPIPVERAWEHVFGLVLMNDWSARDIQKWEYVPLGPFNGKNWATQISPWVVTLEALEPYRLPYQQPAVQDDPEVLLYLREPQPHVYDVSLEVEVVPAGREHGATVTRSHLKHLHWSFAQMIAHHTAGGCNLRPGDLIGSGTISGDTPDSRGCLLELTWGGRDEVQAGEGCGRRYLEDGDAVVLRGWCGAGSGEEGGAAAPRVGFGECRGALLPCR